MQPRLPGCAVVPDLGPGRAMVAIAWETGAGDIHQQPAADPALIRDVQMAKEQHWLAYRCQPPGDFSLVVVRAEVRLQVAWVGMHQTHPTIRARQVVTRGNPCR